MIIVKYGHDGMKQTLQRGVTRRDLTALMRRKAANGWTCEWLTVGTEFEATRDDVAAGAIYRTRPENWPHTRGEPA